MEDRRVGWAVVHRRSAGVGGGGVGFASRGRRWRRGGGVVACLSRLTIDHASLSKRSRGGGG